MYYGFILTHSMYPIDKKLELKDCCFDNPRTSQEIKAVAQILKKANFIGNAAFPETYEQFGKEVISLEMIIDLFFERYNLDRKYLLRKNGKEYSDVYYKMAKNWVILRYDESNEYQYSDYGYKKYKEIIAYINLLTFLSFSENPYRRDSLLIPESFDFFELKSVDRTIKNIIIDLLVLSTARKDEETINNFRYCIFDKTYSKFLKLEKLLEKLLENAEKENLIKYISDIISNYILIEDKKMRIMSLVSVLELLITHKPDSNRYNIEDSIRKQFCNKLLTLLYLNDKNINYAEIEKYLLMIYDLRSAIAHGSFEQIEIIVRKIDKWFLNNSIEHKKYCEEFDIDRVFEYIDESLRKYTRIAINMYLKDKTLIELLKK